MLFKGICFKTAWWYSVCYLYHGLPPFPCSLAYSPDDPGTVI